jgi:hypothetical protein
MMLMTAVCFILAFSARADDYIVFPVNDLGMHCMDEEYSVLALLPPFNVLNVQVVYRNPAGYPMLLDHASIDVMYDGAADPSGSINSFSIGKTGFWLYANQLFGIPLLPGEGLLGFYMPGDAPAPGPQAVPWNVHEGWFSAPGIPITPWDDMGQVNTYPVMKISAHQKGSGLLLNSTDAVLPVSAETNCGQCHGEPVFFKSGSRGRAVMASHQLIEPHPMTEILRLHDAKELTSLMNSQPVLCAGCHYSAALDLSGAGPTGPQVGKPTMSEAMHRYHGGLLNNQGEPIFAREGNIERACYQCHPGKKTQCLRGPMAGAGINCFDCHGNMLAVGGEYPLLPGGSIDGTNDGNPRRPWMDLPRCQSCHTGDEVNHLSGPQYASAPDGVRLEQSYKIGDSSASPILAVNNRFAENTNTLYRMSKGHGGMMCEACHGSTHAEWPNPDPDANDNLTAMQLQGHSGTIIECSTCHAEGTLPLTLHGPHGMHNVDDIAWIDHKHNDFYEHNENECKACHGLDLRGSQLGRAAADRRWVVDLDDGRGPATIVVKKGEEIRCNLCHELPD